ncbi:hypothetical protein [Roseibium sp.]|uniref:hypothetical protein n=1 Tax=Roseibium sp. TaxID=1936156 RepID=UPI003BACB688
MRKPRESIPKAKLEGAFDDASMKLESVGEIHDLAMVMFKFAHANKLSKPEENSNHLEDLLSIPTRKST